MTTAKINYKENVIQFHNLKVNDIFVDDICLAKWPHEKDGYMYKLYKKIDKSFAICIDQKGWGNKRSISAENHFTAMSLVYKKDIIPNKY
jgi:hypothetical protein